ncbi:elongation factor 1-gamma-A-like [Carcharodon carcharias]|uniref:elongation factor 1-gamma-A-like n=1 Tax=Carcharodon carcharias TaxID=13397 RepID=UPI001B7DC140|nr:elongation factor 1-gamma-A-like [Carcharodon carcharias]
MAGMVLYTPRDSWRSYPALIAAEYSNVSLRVVSRGQDFYSETGCTNPYFLNRFRQGKVPVLVADNGFSVQESNAVAYYVSSDVLRGSSRQEAALIQQWINFAGSELIPPIATWIFSALGATKFSKLLAECAKADVKKILRLLNDHLHVRTYLVGEHVTLADITLVCAMLDLYKEVLEPSLRKRYTDLDRWFTTCVNQPPFQKVLGEMTFYEPAVQCPATKLLEARDVTKKASRVETCLASTPKGNGSNEEEVGRVKTGLDKEMSAVEVHPVGSSAEGGPVGVVDPPLKHRPAKVENLIDASEEELSAVCASMEGRTEVRSVAASTEARTTKKEGEDKGSKEKTISDILVDLSEEVVYVTGKFQEQGAAKEAVVGVQEEGISGETESVEIVKLEPAVDGSAESTTAGVTLAPSLREDRLGNIVTLVDKSKAVPLTEICTAGGSEEQNPIEVSQPDVPKCYGGAGEVAAEARMVSASGKGSSIDLKMNDSKPDGPSKEQVTIMGSSEDGLAQEEAVAEVCLAGSLKEARAVSLNTPDPSETDLACKQEAIGAICASKGDMPTTVDVTLLETLKEQVYMIDPSLEHGSVTASVANAPKDDGTAKSGTVDKLQGGRLAREEPMRTPRAHGDGWDSTKSADQLKAEDPFAHLPKSAFVLDEFKQKYSNENISSVALPYLWDHFDKEGWSVWYMEYKYPGELNLDMSSNLIAGLFQCLDGLRKHSFASIILFGTDCDSSISGIWILRGKHFSLQLSEDWQVICEPYSWKKLDVDTDECKAMINEYFMMKEAFQHMGKPFSQGNIFK